MKRRGRFCVLSVSRVSMRMTMPSGVRMGVVVTASQVTRLCEASTVCVRAVFCGNGFSRKPARRPFDDTAETAMLHNGSTATDAWRYFKKEIARADACCVADLHARMIEVDPLRNCYSAKYILRNMSIAVTSSASVSGRSQMRKRAISPSKDS